MPIQRIAAGETARKFFQGRAAIVEFLTRKWASEHGYRLIRELGAFHENRIAVRSNKSGVMPPALGFARMAMKMGIRWRWADAPPGSKHNDVLIAPEDCKFRKSAGPGPADGHPGLTEFGL